MASLSQMERDQLWERQPEGVEAAKMAGTYEGRIKGSKVCDEETLKKYQTVVRILKHNPT
jgi:DNA invertase Pin-like site-specific DNA recombinase